jgi:hypothetical protein
MFGCCVEKKKASHMWRTRTNVGVLPSPAANEAPAYRKRPLDDMAVPSTNAMFGPFAPPAQTQYYSTPMPHVQEMIEDDAESSDGGEAIQAMMYTCEELDSRARSLEEKVDHLQDAVEQMKKRVDDLLLLAQKVDAPPAQDQEEVCESCSA